MLRSLARVSRQAGRFSPAAASAAAVGSGAAVALAAKAALTGAAGATPQQQQAAHWLWQQQQPRWQSSLAEPSQEGTTEADPASAAAAAEEPAAEAAAADSPPAAPEQPSRSVFIRNLPWSAEEEALASLFGQAGSVQSVRVLRRNQRSTGCAVVEYESAEGAAAAIERFDQAEVDGRQIFVREDQGMKPREERPPRQQRNARPGTNFEPGSRLVVQGLPWSLGWRDLKDVTKEALEKAGIDSSTIRHADVRTHPDGKSKGWGVVVCASPADADAAVQALHGISVGGRIITAKIDDFQPGGGSGGGYRGGGGGGGGGYGMSRSQGGYGGSRPQRQPRGYRQREDYGGGRDAEAGNW